MFFLTRPTTIQALCDFTNISTISNVVLSPKNVEAIKALLITAGQVVCDIRHAFPYTLI